MDKYFLSVSISETVADLFCSFAVASFSNWVLSVCAVDWQLRQSNRQQYKMDFMAIDLINNGTVI